MMECCILRGEYTCANCASVTYCSEACARRDWSTHAQYCGARIDFTLPRTTYVLVRELNTIPDIAAWVEQNQQRLMDQYENVNNKILVRDAIAGGYERVVEALVTEDMANDALRAAAYSGRDNMVRIVLRRTRGAVKVPLSMAVQRDYLNVVRVLAPKTKMTVDDIVRYFKMSKSDAMRQFWSTFDPNAETNDMFINLAESGQTVGVRAMLNETPGLDPSARNNQALRRAVRNGHTDIVQMLLMDPRIRLSREDALALQKSVPPPNPQIWTALNVYMDYESDTKKVRRFVEHKY